MRAAHLLADNIKLQGGSEGDVQRFRRRLQALAQRVGYDQSFVPCGFDGEASFREAGHILGSASVELASSRSRVIVSGDLGRPSSPILRDYCTRWTRARPLDLVVMEATYGEREHAHTHGDVERELERIIHRAIAAGGHILVPAFAIGRTQTLLYGRKHACCSSATRRPVRLDAPFRTLLGAVVACGSTAKRLTCVRT